MDILFKIFLIIHIIGGSVGLITGTINIIRKKADKNHRLIGNIFVYAMITAGFSSLVLSILHTNYFLFIVGIFTLYMIITGKRYIYLKLLGSKQKPQMLDWIITIIMLVFGIVFIVFGIYFVVKSNYFGLVFIVFGYLGLSFVKTDFNNFKGKFKSKNYWLLAHLQRMIGGYIASLTAFLVVNVAYLPKVPAFVFWLLPTLIFLPLILKWSRMYEVKKKQL